jgi:outer membrane protein assembly factor BamB
VANERTVLAGSNVGTVWLLDAATGRVRWRHVTGGRLMGLAHGGDTVYISWTDRIPVRKPLDKDEPHPRRVVSAYPTQILALRAHDGSEVWRRDGWTVGRAKVALDGDVLVSDGPSPAPGERILYGQDMNTGEVRWSFDIGPPWGLSERLMGARGGRVFVYEGGTSHRLDVLAGQTGALCWRVPRSATFLTLSQRGRLLAVAEQTGPLSEIEYAINRAEAGSRLGTLSRRDALRALADDGVAYVARGRPPFEGLAAVRILDGTELWRAPGVGAHSAHLIVRENVLYSARFTDGKRAEVVALDSASGVVRWCWRSPGWLPGLLALWGRLIPRVLLFVAAHARRSIIRARDQHDRSIFHREIIHGQWRHPTRLVSGVQIAADDHAVYVGTSLGLIALRARDGKRLWYALPLMDLGWFIPPAAAPSRGKGAPPTSP